jgi:general secretion pathway protein F
MPVFEYVALDKFGKQIKGSLDAESVRAARQRLRKLGIFPTSVQEGSDKSENKKDLLRKFKSERVKPKDNAVATRQLATLVGAGLPLVSALSALIEQTEAPVLRKIFLDVKEQVQEGSSLSRALGRHPKSFPNLYVNMVNAGEESGTLDSVLLNLADHLEASVALRTKIRSALTYPIIMLAFCTLVIIGLFIFVIPNVVEIFLKQGAELPTPTKIMIFISNFLISYWWSIPIALAGAIFGFRSYYKSEHGRRSFDRFLLRLPVFAPIYTKVITARTSLTLGALLGSGVQLLKALDITKKIMGNVHVVEAIQNAKEGVHEGKSLASELKRSGVYPSMLCHMIAVGEKSGELESMLSKAGKAYEQEVNSTLDGLTSLLEPVMMIIVGGVVLAIVVSVLMPMADLIEVIQQ